MAEWISKNAHLTEDETLNNAYIFYGIFSNLGYSLETISALAGNAEAESGINPELEEDGGTGYGIFQWTPKNDLIEACNSLNLSPYTDGTVQCNCLDGELFVLENQWYTTNAFITPYIPSGATADMVGVTAQEFKENTLGWSPDKLAILFMVAYERPNRNPAINHTELRQQLALKWYNIFSDSPVPPTPTPTKRKKMPIWMYVRKR